MCLMIEGEEMEKDSFRQWLCDNGGYSSKKQVSDCLSRVKRTEKALVEAKLISEDLDAAFDLDGGVEVREMLSCMGRTIEAKGISVNLPIGSRQMSPIAAAVRRYFIYKAETGKQITQKR